MIKINMTDSAPSYKDLFASLHNHIKALDRILTGLEHKMDILSSECLLKDELESKSREIRVLNHMIDEQECQIHALKTKLNAAYI